MSIFLKGRKILITCLVLLILLLIFLLTSSNLSTLANNINHQRKVTISLDTQEANFYIPSYLQTQNEPTTQGNIYTNIFGENSIELYSKDKKVNQYYYQIAGMDVTFGLHIPWLPFTANIPFAIAKKTTMQSQVGNVTLYGYPGADGDGHGRGHLGYVEQGDILLNIHTKQNESVGLFFSCYDHSSGANISERCEKTIQLFLKTIHTENNFFTKFLEKFEIS